MADRFYCPDPPADGRLILGDEEARHLGLVLRQAPGAVVEAFDGRGLSYRARVVAIARGTAELEILGGPERAPGPPRDITLATAVPKGDRFDWLVEKAVELGVGRLIPIRSERSVVDPGASKLDRLRRRVVEASKQSGRYDLMEIGPPRDLVDWLSARPADPATARLIAHPGGEPPRRWPGRGPIALTIGPEGGFAPGEVDAARSLGWGLAGLGPTKLRVETAALAAAVAAMAPALDPEESRP